MLFVMMTTAEPAPAAAMASGPTCCARTRKNDKAAKAGGTNVAAKLEEDNPMTVASASGGAISW